MKVKAAFLAACAAVALFGCGGGGGGGDSSTPPSTTASTLSGTAAGGAAIVGAVFVRDSLGQEKSVQVESDGKYTIDVSGMTGPFMLKAVGKVGANSVTYYSAATSADLSGTINITPFTNLIVSNIAASLAESYFASGNFASITPAALAEAQLSLQKKLAPTLIAMGLDASIDLLKHSFKADHSGLDAALDVIKVTVDPATNIATLTNALTNIKIGEDNLSSRADDATPVVLSDADRAALGTAATDLQKIDQLFRTLEALFANALPSVQQLTDSGIFQTDSGFYMSGMNFAQFAAEATSEQEAIGLKFVNLDIKFVNPNMAIVYTVETWTDGTDQGLLVVARADSSSPWKIVGDRRIAEMDVYPTAVLSNGTDIMNGLSVWIDPTWHNFNNSAQEVTSANITGPGLPGSGITLLASDSTSYLVLSGNQGNIIPECTPSISSNCLTVSSMVDNGVYHVKLFNNSTLLNNVNGGNGNRFTISKKPEATSTLAASKAAFFPSFTSITIDGAAFTQLSQLQPGKSVITSWTMPSGLTPDWLSIGSNGFGSVGEDLLRGTTQKSLALPDPFTATPTYASIWLAGQDMYGRNFAASKSY